MLEAPPIRTTFSDDWDELEYCFEHAQHWLYGRKNPNEALSFAERLVALIDSIPGALDTIIPNECLAVVGECRQDWEFSIKHRLTEIELIQRLWRAARKKRGKERDEMLQGYDATELSDRYERLAFAYAQSNQLPEAMKALSEAEEICFAHHIEFDAEEIRAVMFKKIQENNSQP